MTIQEAVAALYPLAERWEETKEWHADTRANRQDFHGGIIKVNTLELHALSVLFNHIAELPNEISSDLETGSHHRNNRASEEFSRRHPALIRWMDEISYRHTGA